MMKLDSPAMKLLMGKELTEEETKQLNEENIKYALVKFLYLEKMKDLGTKLTAFSFTPGDKWMEVPTVDIVNELLSVGAAVKKGNFTKLDFGDRPTLQKSTGEVLQDKELNKPVGKVIG